MANSGGHASQDLLGKASGGMLKFPLGRGDGKVDGHVVLCGGMRGIPSSILRRGCWVGLGNGAPQLGVFGIGSPPLVMEREMLANGSRWLIPVIDSPLHSSPGKADHACLEHSAFAGIAAVHLLARSAV